MTVDPRPPDNRTAARLGRPPLAGETRCVLFRLRLTPDERARLNAMAEEHGETPSQYIRRVLFR